MRLLKRDDAGGVSFTRHLPEAELPGYKYAILSHTWGLDEEEVTYDDIISGTGARKMGYEKIRFCAQQTKRDGLQYFWLDTCCIDKKNTTELSRALISMFRWYANAERSYVFLSDVPRSYLRPDTVERVDWEQDFRSSRWFRRGWTLQELISPPRLEFFSKHGDSLGTKGSLETEISEITRIPIKALRGLDLAAFTIHERRQWQEGRDTREPEDMVYSLLGLLDISMPILYGEGRAKALQRLENEIAVAQKGTRYKDFSLVFSLAEAAVETQHFVARRTELEEVHSNLFSDGSRRAVVLHGLGGIGKTQLALAYAKRHRENYSAILWLNAKDENSIKSSFAKVARNILREHPSETRLANLNIEQNLEGAVDAVKAWLSMSMNTRWLMICDNYDNPKVPGSTDSTAFELRHFLPEAYQGSIIVTTRSAEVKIGHYMRIKKVEPLQDGLKILEYSSGRGSLANDDSAIQLARKLDGLPLALATAGAYLSQSTFTFAEYLDFFEQSWARLQKRSPGLLTYENRTLYSTWQISFSQIEQRNPHSAGLLRWWAYFDNQDLWFELLRHDTNHRPQWMGELTADKLEFQACVQVLCDHGLVEANTKNVFEVESTGYSVHPCVHAWMSSVLNANHNNDLAITALRCVEAHIPWRGEPNASLIQRRLLNHAARCTSYIGDINGVTGLNSVYDTLGDLYQDRGKITEAEKMYVRALQGYEKEVGADNIWTLKTVHSLGSLHFNQGDLAKAEILWTRALKGREKALGAGDTWTLETVHSLGSLYRDQDKIEEAEEMYMRALRGYEKALGADGDGTLQTVMNLGSVYKDQGKPVKAEQWYKRALEGYERSMGVEHPFTLRCAHNLGCLYLDQDELTKAEEMFERTLEGYEKIQGADHPTTLGNVSCLGLLYMKQGRVSEARRCYHRARTGYNGLRPGYRGTINHLGRLLSVADGTTASQAETSTRNRPRTPVEDPSETEDERSQPARRLRKRTVQKLNIGSRRKTFSTRTK